MGRWAPAPIVGGAYSDDTKPWSAQDTVNYIPVKAERPFGRSDFLLRSAPGLRPYVDVANGPIRGLHDVEGLLLAVSGNKIFKISNAQVAIPIGTIPGVSRVSMAHNQIAGGSEVMIATGSAGYVYNTVADTLTKVTDDGFPGFKVCDFVDGYIAGVEPGGRYWLHSDLADAMSFNTLDRSESEAQPDKIVSLIVDHREVWVLNQRTIEPFENTGALTGTFQRVSGTVIEVGCDSTLCVAKMDNSVFWVGGGVVYRADGYTPIRISTHAIEQALSRCNLSRCFAFTYEDRGHKIYYLTCPDGQTWGYDVASGEWHRRQSYGLDRWRLNALVKSGNHWVGGDYASGKLYTLNWDYMLEEDQPHIRERVSGVLSDHQNPVFVNAVELVIDTGGVRTVAVPFPEQPDPPTITGNAPDGSVGLAYAGYSYTLGGGTAPYSVTLRSGSLPGGIEVSTAGALSTPTPTEPTLGTFILRVTDANGLWAELTDTIAIGFSMVASGGKLSFSGGIDWSATSINVPGGAGLGAAGAVGRFAVWGTSAAYYTNDSGLTFPAATLPGGVNLLESGRYLDGNIVIPLNSTNGLVFSTDNGATYTQYAAGALLAVSKTDDLFIGANSSNFRTAATVNSTWSSGAAHGVFSGLAFEIDASPTEARMGGAVGGGGGAKIVRTTDGSNAFNMALPTLAAGDYITAVHYDRFKEIWLAGTHLGHLLYDEGDGWELATFTAIGDVASIASNGAVNVAVGATGGGSPGHISVSPDGKAWTNAPYDGTFALNTVTALQGV